MWDITIKELALVMRTIRFVVIVLVCCLLMPISVAVLSNDYAAEVEDYESRVQLESRRTTELDNNTRVFRPVPELSALFRGVNSSAINGFDLESFNWDEPISSGTQSPTHALFPVVDLTFIIGVVLSGLAIILTFDAVNGEKQGATLRLLITTPTPRSSIILGKWFGFSLALLIPFLLGMIISLLVFSLVSGHWFSSGENLALLLSICIACVYLSLFVLLGIFVSSLTHSPSRSIIAGLGVWGFTIILMPNLLVAAASTIHPISPPQQIQRDVRFARNEYLSNLRKRNMETAGRAQEMGLRSRPEVQRMRRNGSWPLGLDADKQFLDFAMAYNNEAWQQEDLARTMSMISPYGGLTESLTILSNTGADAQRHFISEATLWGNRFFEQIFSDPDNPLSDEQIADIHNFSYEPIGVEERIGTAALPGLSLVFFTAVLLFASIIAFNRYDVR